MSRKNGLKVRQDILAFIDGFTQERGYAPSVREIAKQVHLSLANVQYHLDVLEGHGYIIRQENTSRSIRLLVPINSQTNLNNSATRPTWQSVTGQRVLTPWLRC